MQYSIFTYSKDLEAILRFGILHGLCLIKMSLGHRKDGFAARNHLQGLGKKFDFELITVDSVDRF